MASRASELRTNAEHFFVPPASRRLFALMAACVEAAHFSRAPCWPSGKTAKAGMSVKRVAPSLLLLDLSVNIGPEFL